MLLIDDLFFLPFQFGYKVLQGIKDEVDKELYPDEEQCKEKLLALQMQLESGQITEEDYEVGEEKVMKRLREFRRYRKEEAGK